MSWSLLEWRKMNAIESEQRQQLRLLEQMSEKQDRQIKLLERIVSALENRQDDGR